MRVSLDWQDRHEMPCSCVAQYNVASSSFNQLSARPVFSAHVIEEAEADIDAHLVGVPGCSIGGDVRQVKFIRW